MQAAQQHDLTKRSAARILSIAAVKADQTVVDAGAGTGALTAGLLAAGARVHAVERDTARVAHLRTTFATDIAAGRLTVHSADVLRWRSELPPGWRVVANPPFNLTAPLLHRWLVGDDNPPAALDLVLQREAVDKITPRRGEQTRSSALVTLAGTAGIALGLPREATVPPSRVDLAMWSFRRRNHDLDDLRAVDRLLEIAFAGPHTVQDALRGLATGVQVRRQAAEHGWKPTDHPRTLPPTAWLAFAKLLKMCHKL